MSVRTAQVQTADFEMEINGNGYAGVGVWEPSASHYLLLLLPNNRVLENTISLIIWSETKTAKNRKLKEIKVIFNNNFPKLHSIYCS